MQVGSFQIKNRLNAKANALLTLILILVLTHFARFLCSAARMIYVYIDVYLYLRVYVRNCRYVRKAFACKACFLRDVVGWSRIFWNLQEFYVYVCVYVYVNVYVYVHLYLYAYIYVYICMSSCIFIVMCICMCQLAHHRPLAQTCFLPVRPSALM